MESNGLLVSGRSADNSLVEIIELETILFVASSSIPVQEPSHASAPAIP